ncbi:MAG: hypothetical protein J5836_00530 [Clostridia bacterium]|nr:hypothetical protein [Clostridia bacterium]
MEKIKLGNVFILGDSYSTFKGCIPEGYKTYYDPSADDGKPVVSSPDLTWWGRVLNATDSNLVLNCSWSGTTICNTSYGGKYCPEDSFIGRADKVLFGGNYVSEDINTFFVFGGTNDGWSGAPIGEYRRENITEEDKKCFRPAFIYLISSLKEKFKKSRIIVIINCDIPEVVSESILKVSGDYGCETVILSGIEKIKDHPSQLGMKQIADQVIEHLQKEVNK